MTELGFERWLGLLRGAEDHAHRTRRRARKKKSPNPYLIAYLEGKADACAELKDLLYKEWMRP